MDPLGQLWGCQFAHTISQQPPQLRADLKRRVESIVLTEHGLVPLDLTDPSVREALLGPAGATYGNKGVVVGSCALRAARSFVQAPQALAPAVYCTGRRPDAAGGWARACEGGTSAQRKGGCCC